MKPALRKAFTLLLCLSLCLLLAPAALAEDAQSQPADASGQELFPVRFYNEKGYDLIGLQVTDAVGHALDPSSREDGWTYLLAPGAYSYAYHDDRGIFLDLDETGFTVDGAAEISLTLRAFLTENADFAVFVNPFYQDTPDKDTIAWHEEALSEELERVVERLAAGEEASGLSQSDVFYGSENEIEGYAETLREALIAREPSVSLTVYSGNTRWSADDYTSVLLEVYQKAFQHTGNQQEGDTLRWEVYSYGYGGGTYNNYDYNKQSYYHVIPYSFTYQSSAAQEAETAAEVERVVQSLSLNGKSDYEKFAAINEYLYMNVNYDDSYQKHSSDNALIEYKSVCQGFATAFYRLSLAAGLDARVVSSSTMGHGWNIAKLGNHYYYLDATWDSNWREQGYPLSLLPYFFIHGSNWWLENHTLKDDNGNLISGLGDEFGYTSDDLYYDPAFATYVVSDAEFDPTAVGVAVASTNFPDETFRDYVSANCDTDGDGYLSTEEIAAVTTIDVAYRAQWNQWEEIPGDYDWVLPEAESFNTSAPYPADDISSASGVSSTLTEAESFGAATVGSITSLKGIEFFTALQKLYCYGNQITALDLSRNTELDTLACGLRLDGVNYGNKLSSLNVSNNKKLRYFACDGNLLKTLDLRGNTDLEMLQCIGNELKSLIINKSPKLSWLYCWDNKLTSLDISGNPNLEYLDCGINALKRLSVAANTKLKELECYDNAITALNIAGNTELSTLDCSGNALTNLDVSKNTMLQKLWCSDNKLSDLDVSQNSELLLLSCYNNSLSRLDVTGNTALRGIACQNNGLKALNISPCGVLTQLITDVNPEIEDGVVMYMDNTESDTFRWLLYDEAVLLITPDMVPGFVLPAALTRIEDGAFADVPNLITVYIPSTVKYIDPNAFGTADELYIFGQAGSAAEAFAQGSSAYAFIPAA